MTFNNKNSEQLNSKSQEAAHPKTGSVQTSYTAGTYPEFKHMNISHIPLDVIEKAKKVRFLVLDIDGVCTDGRLFMDANGQTTKAFNVHDGIGIKTAMLAGIGVGVITGRQDPCVEARMKPLGVLEYHCGFHHKLEPLKLIAERQNISFSEMAYVGDDIIDLDPLCHVILPIAVANAREEVKQVAAYITQIKGGHGAVREAVEFILACQGGPAPASYWTKK